MNLYNQYSHAAVVLPVANLSETLKFYEDKLDFKTTFRWGDPLEYVVGNLGENTQIHFTQNTSDAPLHSSLYVFVFDVNQVYGELLARNVKISNEIDDREYGMRDFEIHDNNKFRITLGTNIDRLNLRS